MQFRRLLLRDADYLKMLEAARTSGMKIVAVDANRPYDEGDGTSPHDPRAGERHEPRVNRDELMAGNIDKILKETRRKGRVLGRVKAFGPRFGGRN
jgi:hypothetical protein